jgi:hypothetical protein
MCFTMLRSGNSESEAVVGKVFPSVFLASSTSEHNTILRPRSAQQRFNLLLEIEIEFFHLPRE